MTVTSVRKDPDALTMSCLRTTKRENVASLTAYIRKSMTSA